MERLIEGFRRFRETYYKDHRELYDALVAYGQAPRVMVVTCADSRVDPQLMFGAAPGEIFVVRNIANLIPPHESSGDHHGTSAALEFAVRTLRVEHLIILGHARCGGIGALLQRESRWDGDFIGAWMDIARPARERALELAGGHPESAQRLCEHEAIKTSLENLMTFSWIREPVEQGTLRLHGWYFDLESGDLLGLQNGEFAPI